MKQISLIKDKIDGSPFAVLLINKQQVTAFGAPGQGKEWANWVNAGKTTLSEIEDILDVRLVAQKPVPSSAINESDISTFLDQETVDSLMGELQKKTLLHIVETKSEPEPEFDDDIDVPDFTSINDWPIADISLSAIDVAYKSQLTDYKAKTFHTSRKRRALELEVKWARAVWDNDRQGWRCPPNTVNGGQFTNRMGLGCTTGMIRRLGQTLMSIEDRNKLQLTLPGLEDPRGFLYRAGELIDQRAETRVREFAERKERRAARRVRTMIAKEGKKAQAAAEKEQRKIGKTNKRFASRGEKFRDIYNVYTPDASRTARARAAAAIKLRQMAMGAEQRALQNLNRSERRRYRAMRNVTEEKLSERKLRKLRDFGGKIPGSNLGGYLIADKANEDEIDKSFDKDGAPHVWRVFSSMDEMHANPWFGKETLTDDSGAEIPNPHKNHKWVTVEEVLGMASLNRATKPMHDWLEMRRGRGFKEYNGQNGESLIRFADADELRKVEKQFGHHGVRQKLKDDGKGPYADRGKGKNKTKPAQSGPIGDIEWQPDEMPPSVRKRVSNAWTRSRQTLGEWIRNLDPLLDEDEKTRRQRRRSQRSNQKTSSAATASTVLTDMIGEKPTAEGVMQWLKTSMGNVSSNQRGFSFSYLDSIWTNDPTAEAENYLWNSVVGEPTRQFETLKNLADRIIDEHGAAIMTQADDSNDALTVLQSMISRSSGQEESVTKLSKMGYHNSRVVTLFDGEEEKKAIVVDTITIEPWYEKDNGEATGRAGLVNLISTSVQLNAPDDVVEMAERGELTLKELVRMAKEAGEQKGQLNGDLRFGSAFGYGLDDGPTPPVVWWSTTRNISFNKAGAPLSINTSDDYFGPKFEEGTRSTHIPGSRNARVDLRTGSLISGRMATESILTPEGQAAWEDTSIDPWTGEPLSPSLASMFAGGTRDYSGGRRGRQVRGSQPRQPGLVGRFLSGEGRQMARERREARRVLKGKLPRDTRPLRQRIQASLYERGRRVTGEARPEWLQAPPIDTSVIEQESLRQTGELPPSDVVSTPPLPHIYEFPTPSQFPTDADWKNSGDNQQRLDNLNQSLQALGASFFPPVSQRDIDMAPELAEIGKEWIDDLNDPTKPQFPGEESNWGHTTWVPDGDITYVFDTRDETMPPIAIVHNPTGTTHMIGKDGKHLLSLVARKTVNGEDIWVPVGSRETHARISGEDRQQTGFIQTLLGKFRKRDTRQQQAQKPGLAGAKRRQRNVALRSQPNGDPWGIQQYKTHALGLGIENANIVGPYFFPSQQRVGETLTNVTPLEEKTILVAAQSMSERLSASLKRQLGLGNNDALTVDLVKNKIEDLKTRGKSREAGIMTNDLHDLAVLDDLFDSQDVFVINNLKPGRRHALIESTGTTLSDRQKKQRKAFSADDIHVPANAGLSQAGRPKRPEFRTFPSGQPNLDEVSPDAGMPLPQKQQTGPALIPGVGDVTGTIVFQNGKYFDTSTNRYLEDLSGLDSASPDVIYTPISMDGAFTNGIDEIDEAWPIIRVDSGPGIPTRRLAAIAPGWQNPNIPYQTSRDRAVNRIVSMPQSFTEAFYLLRNRWRTLAAGDDSQTARRWGTSITHLSERLDDKASPLLAMADGLESDLGLSTTFAPVNDVRSAPANATIGELVQALRNASDRGSQSNPLFAKYLDDELLSDADRALGLSPGTRAGFIGQNRSVLQVLDSLGLRTELPFETIYIPAGGNPDGRRTLPEQWDIFDSTATNTLALRHLNEALQLDYTARVMSDKLSSGKNQEWDDMYGTRVGGRWDLTQANVDEIERQRDLAWERATRSLVSAIHGAQIRRNDALRNFAESSGNRYNLTDDNPDDMFDATQFVNNGVIAEQLQSLLTKHVLSNPRVMETLSYSSIRQMEDEARKANQRMDRLEALRASSAAVGLKNKPEYTPDDIDPITMQPILDPHGEDQVQNAANRTAQEVLQLLDDHAASGFTQQADIDPATGVVTPQPIVEEQIEALALIDYAVQKRVNPNIQADDYGYSGMPEEDTKFGHLDLDNLPAEQLEPFNNEYHQFWAFLEASGFNGHPVLLSDGEFRDISTAEDANGNRQSMPIARGQTSSYRGSGLGSRMLQRLRRALTGQGAQQHGPGEYWSGKPNEWSPNREETTVGLLIRDRHKVGAGEILIGRGGTYHGNEDVGLLAQHHYEALWSVANALGAKGFGRGVNTNHGTDYSSEIAPNSVKFDSVTGLYDPADLDALQSTVDRLMSQGVGGAQPGLMTVESWVDRNNFFVDVIIPERNNPGAARNESAIEERAKLNAFLAQNLSWLIQLAQLRRDESDPINGRANKQWNRRLDAAGHSLVMMEPNTRAAMAGYDAIVRHTQNSISPSSSPGEVNTRFGDYDIWEDANTAIPLFPPTIVLVWNRSKLPMLRQTVLDSGMGRHIHKRLSDPTLWLNKVGMRPEDILPSITPPGPNASQLELQRWENIKNVAYGWGIEL